MVALMLKLGSLFSNSEFWLRLPFNLMSIASIWLIWDLLEHKNLKQFIVVTLSLPLLQFGGILALPDTPLLFFSLLFLRYTLNYLKVDSVKNAIFLSLVIACFFYSKYHGLLVVLLTVSAIPNILKRKSFYFIVILTILFYLPHMYWQYMNDFVSFKFHLTGRSEKHFDVENILNYILGQWFLFGFLLLSYFVFKFKNNYKTTPLNKILLYNVLGFLTILFFMSFRNPIEANWTVTATAFFAILFINMNFKLGKKLYLLGAPPLLLAFAIKLYILTPQSLLEREKIGRLNEVKFWDVRADALKNIVGKKIVVAETYQIGAKFSYHLKRLIPVKHFKGRKSHYSLLNLTDNIDKNTEIYYLTPRKHENSKIIETNYKQPVYIIKTTLKELEDLYL